MKKKYSVCLSLLCGAMLLFSSSGYCQSPSKTETVFKSESDQEKKAAEWVESLNINDIEKENRLKKVIATHLETIRNWHNDHPFTSVPAGINPINGKPLSELDRQIIANSAYPKSVHETDFSNFRNL